MWIEHPAVVAGLDSARNLRAIRIAAMEQQLTRAQPTRIEVGEIAARPITAEGFTALVWNENVPNVVPHAPGKQESDREKNFPVHVDPRWSVSFAPPRQTLRTIRSLIRG